MTQNVNRIIVDSDEAKQSLKRGVDQVCNVVGSTMGYRGSNNIFETFGGKPHITKDGWDSLDMIFLSDPTEHMACELVKEACHKTFEKVGDNTTLTCVLVQAFFNYSLEELQKGINAIEISKSLLESFEKIKSHIEKLAVPITPKIIYDIAKTAGNNDDEIATLVSQAFEDAGEFGSVSHKRANSDETTIELIKGHPIDSGYTHEGFVNVTEKQMVVYDNPYVLISHVHFTTIKELTPFLKVAFPENATGVEYLPPTPLIIIGTMEHQLEELLVANTQKGLPICVIRPPYMGKKGREILSDLSVILNCDVLKSHSADYKGKENTYLGTCAKIEITEKDAVVTLAPNFNDYKQKGRLHDLKGQIKNSKSDAETAYLKERIARVTGGIATIMVGGITPSEVEEKMARYDDAICAVRSAKDGGVVAGGGIALLDALKNLQLDSVTKESIKAPFAKIMFNASIDPSSKPLPNYPIGYDVKKYKEVDMFEAGILDTAKGIIISLENAISTSNNLLRSNYVLPFKRNTLQ